MQLNEQAQPKQQQQAADITMSRQVMQGTNLAEFNALPEKSRERALAKLWILKAFKEFTAGYGYGYGINAAIEFTRLYNLGLLPAEEWVTQYSPNLSVRNLFRWRQFFNNGGICALADRRKASGRKGHLQTKSEIKEFIIALLLEHPEIKVPVIRAAINHRYNLDVSLRTVQYWIANIQQAMQFLPVEKL